MTSQNRRPTMKDKQAKYPQLRFKGFTDPWEQRKLSDAVDNIGTGKSKYMLQEKSDLAKYEVLGSTSVIGYDEDYDHEGDFILTARVGANAGNLYHHSGKVKITDNTVFIQGKNLAFIYNLLTQFDLKKLSFGTGQPLVKASELKNLILYFPNNDEQAKIGSYFKQLDHLIAANQRKLDLLKEQKKGYLQKMFPKNGAKVPELRFAGFADDWEQRKLGDITKISTGKLDANAMVENGKYDFYTSGIKKYRIDVAAFEGPSITIAGNGATVGYMHLADNKFNAYQRTYVLQEFLVDRSFIFSEIGNKLPKKIKQEARTGNIPYIVMDMLTELKLSIPQNNSEQQKIGSFFKQLDDTIDLHQRKLEKLQELKKGYLQKMFC